MWQSLSLRDNLKESLNVKVWKRGTGRRDWGYGEECSCPLPQTIPDNKCTTKTESIWYLIWGSVWNLDFLAALMELKNFQQCTEGKAQKRSDTLACHLFIISCTKVQTKIVFWNFLTFRRNQICNVTNKESEIVITCPAVSSALVLHLISQIPRELTTQDIFSLSAENVQQLNKTKVLFIIPL